MKIFLTVLVVIVIIIVGILVFGGSEKQEQTTQTHMDQNQEVEEQGGLIVEDVREGDGEEAVSGTTVSVHYVGTFEDGTEFDSSRDRGTPFSFRLGAGQVIAGWDQGVAGMKVGGLRKLTIPPSLAYGSGGVPGAIPPNSTLFFEVELLDVQN